VGEQYSTGQGSPLTVHLDDGVGDLDLVERHGRPGAPQGPGEGGGGGGRDSRRLDGVGGCLGEEEMTEGAGDHHHGVGGF